MSIVGKLGGYRGGRGALEDFGPADVGAGYGGCRRLRARACGDEGGGGWKMLESRRGSYVEGVGHIVGIQGG